MPSRPRRRLSACQQGRVTMPSAVHGAGAPWLQSTGHDCRCDGSIRSTETRRKMWALEGILPNQVLLFGHFSVFVCDSEGLCNETAGNYWFLVSTSGRWCCWIARICWAAEGAMMRAGWQMSSPFRWISGRRGCWSCKGGRWPSALATKWGRFQKEVHVDMIFDIHAIRYIWYILRVSLYHITNIEYKCIQSLIRSLSMT